jgi:tetratricopeptide (TPR) repeat protein
MTEGMQHLVDLCHKHEVALTIMVHPWRNNVMRGEVEDRHVVYWRNFAREKNIGFINLYPVFIHEIPPGEVIAAYFIPFDNHWTAEGHALVADKLFSFIGTRYSTVAADLYHYHKGIVYRDQQQNDSALIHFKEAIIRNPAKATYYYQRGKTYLEAGEYVQAAADFQQAWSWDSTFRQAKLAMEQVEAEQNTNEQTQILQTNPTATAYIVRGKALLVLNRYQSAYEDFEQAFTLEPDNKVPYYYIGYIESNLIKAPREAIKYFDRAIALDTAYIEAYQERAMAFLQMGAKEKAMIDIQQVAQLGGEVDETLWEEVNNLKNNY